MKEAPGPATHARLERWAHDEESAGFHHPPKTPQISTVSYGFSFLPFGLLSASMAPGLHHGAWWMSHSALNFKPETGYCAQWGPFG